MGTISHLILSRQEIGAPHRLKATTTALSFALAVLFTSPFGITSAIKQGFAGRGAHRCDSHRFGEEGAAAFVDWVRTSWEVVFWIDAVYSIRDRAGTGAGFHGQSKVSADRYGSDGVVDAEVVVVKGLGAAAVVGVAAQAAFGAEGRVKRGAVYCVFGAGRRGVEIGLPRVWGCA